MRHVKERKASVTNEDISSNDADGVFGDPEIANGRISGVNNTFAHTRGEDPALSLSEFLSFCSYLTNDPRYEITPDTGFKVFVCCCDKLEHYSTSVLHDVLSEDAHIDELLATRCSVKEFFRMCALVSSRVTIRTDANVLSRESVMTAMQDKRETIIDHSLAGRTTELVDLSEQNPMQRSRSEKRLSGISRLNTSTLSQSFLEGRNGRDSNAGVQKQGRQQSHSTVR
jgi:hypothetical protein